MKRMVFMMVLSFFLLTTLGTHLGNAEETISVLTMTGPWISGPVKVHGPEWGQKTGNKVEVIEAAFADIFPKVQQAAATRSDAFDLLLVANIWMADMVGWNYVLPLDDYIKQPEVMYL